LGRFIDNNQTLSNLDYGNVLHGDGSREDNLFFNSIYRMPRDSYLQAVDVEIFQGMLFKEIENIPVAEIPFHCETKSLAIEEDLQKLPESLFSEGKIASPCGDENIESTRDNLAKYRKWLDSLEAKYSINILNWLIPSAYAQNKGNDGVFRAQGKSNLLGLNLTRTLQVQTNIGATCGHDFNEVVAELPNCEGGCTDEQMKALVAKLDRIFARTSTLKEGSDEAVKVAEEYQEIERKKPSDAQQFSDSPKTLVAKVENQQNLKNNNKQDGDDQDNSGKGIWLFLQQYSH
jgi:copper chaperone CopZ